MERVFIAGFALCLLFLVGCGGAIGTEAYLLSTTGELPPDLDNFIVQVHTLHLCVVFFIIFVCLPTLAKQWSK